MLSNMLTIAHDKFYLKMHRSIVYFDISDLLQFLEDLEFHRSIAVLLLVGSCNDCFRQL